MGITENHYLHMDQMTDHHREKIAELRKRAAADLKKYPEYDTDYSMLRWLMGWDYDIDTILPKLSTAIDTLVNLGLDGVEAESAEQINSFIRSMSNAADYFPGGLMGQDDEGNVIYMQAMAGAHPKTLVKAGCVSELYRLSVAETELAFKLVRRAEANTGKKLGVKIIMDLDGFSMDLLYTPTLKIYLNLLSMMQDIFPDFARRIFLINTPMMISTVYAMVSPVLSKQTREKVTFLGSNWKEELVADLGAHNIYPHWGGTKGHENPKGDARLGGKIPEKLWYNPESNPDDGEKSSFNKLTISARTKGEVTVRGEKGRSFRWIFRVSSGDVDFWAEANGNPAYPKFRCSTEFHPELGRFECKHSADYTFYFDNSHGKVFGKDVKYKIVLE